MRAADKIGEIGHLLVTTNYCWLLVTLQLVVVRTESDLVGGVETALGSC